MLRIGSVFGIMCVLAFAPGSVLAQDDTGGGDMGGDTGTGADTGDMGGDTGAGGDVGGDATLLGDEQVSAEEEGTGTTVGTYHDPSDPYEDPNTGYWFIGLNYRHVWVPQFILNMFVDEPGGDADLTESASNPGFGLEVTYRKDNFSVTGNLFWAGYYARGPFRASGDPEGDTEIIDSSLSVLFLSAAFLWSTPFSEMVALEYGLDVGLGVVFGKLIRTEAWREPGGPWAECEMVGSPATPENFCDGPPAEDGMEGGHYNVEARYWTDGGSVPNVVPWLAIPHIALRFKPVHQFQMRIEAGFGGWFFFGGSLSYGF